MTVTTFSPYVFDVLRKVNRKLLFEETRKMIRSKEAVLLLKTDSIYIFIELALISCFLGIEFSLESKKELLKYWNDGLKKARFRFSKTPFISKEEEEDLNLFYRNIDLNSFVIMIKKEFDRAPDRSKEYSEAPIGSSNMIATDKEQGYLESFYDLERPI